jgi:hypothetical protein
MSGREASAVRTNLSLLSHEIRNAPFEGFVRRAFEDDSPLRANPSTYLSGILIEARYVGAVTMPVDARVETPGLGWFDLELLPAAVAGACPYRIDVAARYQVPAEQFWLDWRTWVEDSARSARDALQPGRPLPRLRPSASVWWHPDRAAQQRSGSRRAIPGDT